MKVLDTSVLSAGERAEAFQDVCSTNCSTSAATFEDETTLHAQMHFYDLGPASVFNIEASGTTLRRTPRMALQIDDSSICLALPVRTDNRMTWEKEDVFLGPRDMILVDLSSPYVYGWRGEGASYAFHVDYDDLGLPMDTIRTAARQLTGSPLYPMVRDHILHVTTAAERLADSGSAFQVATASVELMRALIVSAAEDTSRLPDLLDETLAVRVQAFVREHLREPELGPAMIARAHWLSLRSLYKLYETLGTSLEQSIIDQRLQGARADLGAPRQRYATIAATARAWGFGDPTFFSHRFRRAYGLTPRQWLTRTREVPAAPEGAP